MEYVRISSDNRERISAFIAQRWFSTKMVIRGQVIDMTKVDGIVAMDGDAIMGLVTYAFYGETCEILSLDSMVHGRGIGTALIEKTVCAAREKACRRVILITTNDNVEAIYFYQRRGFDMARIYRNALDASRMLKPEIPLIGEHGIPLRHEIEFELNI